MAWQTIRGDWGTHVADPGLSDAWVAEWRRRVDAARPLVALGAQPAPWADQRAAIVEAWQAAGNAYRAANIPPPSDPAYRKVLRDWYGRCTTTQHGLESYQVEALVSQGGGQMSRALDAIWHAIKPGGDTTPRVFERTAVRLSLASDGTTVSTCLEATGDGDCAYRGLFTGCADTRSPRPVAPLGMPQLRTLGVYAEVSCDQPYGADTFEWYDGPAGSRYSPPLRLSLDVLAELLNAWTARGNALATIDAARSFVLVSNLSNAALAEVLPSELITQSITLAAEAQRQSTGANPQRAMTLAAIGVATAACASAAGPFAPWCAVVGGAAAVIAQLWPAAIGVPVDALGLAVLDPRQSSAFLAAAIAMPDASGVLRLDVPPVVPGTVKRASTKPLDRIYSAAHGPGWQPPTATRQTSGRAVTALGLNQKSQQQAIVTPGSSPLVVLGVFALAALALGGGLK